MKHATQDKPYSGALYAIFKRHFTLLRTGWGWRSVTWVGLTLPSCPANSAFPSAELGCRLTANVNPTQVTDQQPHHVDNLLTNRPPAAQPLHSRRPIAGSGSGHPLRGQDLLRQEHHQLGTGCVMLRNFRRRKVSSPNVVHCCLFTVHVLNEWPRVVPIPQKCDSDSLQLF